MQDDYVTNFREFNRFHTRLIGALNEGLLSSDFSLPQCRVIYEVASAPDDKPLSAQKLAEILRVDKGYLSRLVSGLVEQGLIDRIPSKQNAKRLELRVTELGQIMFNGLNASSELEVRGFLDKLSENQQLELSQSMQNIRKLLGDLPIDKNYVLRAPKPGDLGKVVSAHAKLYTEEYGWDWTFEGMVAGIIAEYVENHDPNCENCWIAELDGEMIGSIFIVKEDETTAKLRMLYVDEKARGLGLGRKLVEEAINFSQNKGYKRMILWTNDILTAACSIYEKTGFELIEEEKHHSFGQDLVGQIWARDL